MTYQPLYAIIDDGIGRRTSHSRHGRVTRINGEVNTNRGKAFSFIVETEDPLYPDKVKVRLDLTNVKEFEMTADKNGNRHIEYVIDRPLITAREFRTGEQ